MINYKYNVIMEKDSNTLYGYIYSLSFARLFLQATTWLFAYTVARANLEMNPALEFITAAIIGIGISIAIDGSLSLLLNDLLPSGKHPPYKWALAIGFSILTGSTTFVSGVFLGEAKRSGLGNEDRAEILAQSSAAHEKQLSRLDADLEEIQGKIAELEANYRRDTAIIISNMTPNHRMLYRTGKYKPYLKSSATLKENVDRIEALGTALQLELSSQKGRRYTITKARDQLAGLDPEASGKGKIGVIDARNAKMGALISGSIYVVDIVAILMVWALFFLIKDKIASGAKLDVKTSSLARWLLDRSAILQNKLLSAFSGADDEIAEAARMFISIPVGLIQLLAWIAGIFAVVVTAPTRLYRPRPLMKKKREEHPPHEDVAPSAVPVRSGGQFDAYEMQRRIEMQGARLEMLRQEQERKAQEERERAERDRKEMEEMNRAALAEQRRQMEEQARIRQEEERRQIEAERKRLSEEKARQMAELSEKNQKKRSDSKKPKPVSDTDSSEVSAKVVGNKVKFDGVTYNLSELAKLTDRAATVYNRQFTLSTPEGRKKNADRWQAIKPVLEQLGYEIQYKDGHKVGITGGRTINAKP